MKIYARIKMGDAISAMRRPVVILSTTASTFFFFAISSSVRCSLDFLAILSSVLPQKATSSNRNCSFSIFYHKKYGTKKKRQNQK